MKIFQNFFLFFGRLFLSIIFILSAINKVLHWQATERCLVALLCDWHSYLSNNLFFQKIFTFLLPWVPAILVVITAIELLGGLLVFFGLKVRFGAFLLICFLLPATVMLHHFWFVEEGKKEIEMVLFLKNIAILGGLFYLLAIGKKGGYEKKIASLDNPTITDEQ